METKTFYLACFGQNQVPFKSKEALIEYFQNSGNLFDAIIDSVKFYEMTIVPIDSPLK